MLTEERRKKIVEILQQRSSVTITELEKTFSVSGETVRRDLLVLEGNKQLIRVYGGALSISNNIHEKEFDVRQYENVAEKQELSECAVNFINEGDIISIDPGSTAVELCGVLKKKFKNLTIITNSLMLFNILSQNTCFRLILCSGEFSREKDGFTGMLTVDAIKKLHISKAFICPSCISLKHGITDFNENYINVVKAYKESSEKCFVIADNSKFEILGIYNVIPLTTDITVITDHNLSDEIYKKYIDADIDIVRG